MAEQKKLTIEGEYCQNWTIQDALRELLQNALDTRTKVEFSEVGKFWEIKDNGSGLKLADFLIGRSSKRDDKKVIGQFGEGAPIGCLVLARAGREVVVRALNKQYSFSFQYDKGWEASLLTIDILDIPTIGGTSVLVECSAEEIEEAKGLFLKFNPKKILATALQTAILDSPGNIYVNGLKVTNVEAMFGYNFKGQKELVNRDRSAIGYSAIKTSIGEVLSNIGNQAVVTRLLEIAAKNPLIVAEFNCKFYPRRTIWKRAARDLWGDKVCLACNPDADLRAMEKGWKVVEFPWDFKYSLRDNSILPRADQVIVEKAKQYITLSQLSAEDRAFFKEGKGIADWLAKEADLYTYSVRLFRNGKQAGDASEEFGNCNGHGRNAKIGINVKLIEGKMLERMIGVVLHEYTHATFGYGDYSRGFENDLTTVIAKLGVLLAAGNIGWGHKERG
jgi:hypothetical protein